MHDWLLLHRNKMHAGEIGGGWRLLCVSSKYPTNPGRLRPLSVWRAHA